MQFPVDLDGLTDPRMQTAVASAHAMLTRARESQQDRITNILNVLLSVDRQLAAITNIKTRLDYLIAFQFVFQAVVQDALRGEEVVSNDDDTLKALVKYIDSSKARNFLELWSFSQEQRAQAAECFLKFNPLPKNWQEVGQGILHNPDASAAVRALMAASMSSLSMCDPDFQPSNIPEMPFTAVDVQPPSSPDTSYLHCFFTERKLLLLFQNQGGVEKYVVDESHVASFRACIDQYFAIYDKSHQDGAAQRIQDALQQLIDGCEAMLNRYVSAYCSSRKVQQVPCRRLIITPHDDLHCIPFNALPCCYDLGIIIASSVLTHQKTRERITQMSNRSTTAVAASGLKIWACDADGSLKFHHLEARCIQRLAEQAQVQPISYEASNRKTTLNNTQCKYLHVITHGIFDVVTPDESRFVLTSDDKTDIDAQLLVHDLLGQSICCDLAVLAACETGHCSDGRKANHEVGMANAFLLAGTSNVITARWTVSDLSAAIFMAYFYRAVFKSGPTHDVCAVLRETQQWMRVVRKRDLQRFVSEIGLGNEVKEKVDAFSISERNGCPLSHPYHWAPYYLMGTGDIGRLSS